MLSANAFRSVASDKFQKPWIPLLKDRQYLIFVVMLIKLKIISLC